MRVSILDLEMGNLRSVQKAFDAVGCAGELITHPEQVMDADRLVLPGVGAFPDAMRRLQVEGLGESLLAFLASGRPFLGICLGLQLLFDEGHEHGVHPGLGVLKGTVRPFPRERMRERKLKVPHMGWNRVRRTGPGILAGLEEDPYCYFVHSYHVVPGDSAIVTAWTDHGGDFCSAVQKDNIQAVQFHPEKSQRVGLRILQEFLSGRR